MPGLHEKAAPLTVLLRKDILSFARNRLYAALYAACCTAACIFCKSAKSLFFIAAGTMFFADLAYTSMKNDLKSGAPVFIRNLTGGCRRYIITKIIFQTVLELIPYALMTAISPVASPYTAYPFLPLYLIGLAAFSLTGAFLTKKSDSVIWAIVTAASLTLFYVLQSQSLPLQLVLSALYSLIFIITAMFFCSRI